MLLRIPDILTPGELTECRKALEAADWIDGRGTAGHLSMRVKNNTQLRYDNPVARRLGEVILSRLERHPTFMSAALPDKIVPPLFNRYAGGQHYGPHIDGAIRPIDGTPHRVRTDLSATLFLSAPEDYDGGELTIGDDLDGRSIKLPAGHMVLYSASSVHHVEPVTRGARYASFFWIQSMVREESDRALLFRLDTTIRQLQMTPDYDHAAVVQLSNIYHNLLRRWADT